MSNPAVETAPIPEGLTVLGPRGKYPKVTLVDPASWGAVLLALEIDHFRLPVGFMLWAESALKKRVLKQLNEFVGELKGSESVGENSPVEDAWLFKATVIPPGKGRFLQQRPEVKIAKFDVALLVQCKSLEAARELRASERWQKEEGRYRKGGECAVTRTLTVTASNTRRIAAVDHTRQGCFLLNYFYADSLETNLKIWEYTAGWFQKESGLNNSTLLFPDDESRDPAEGKFGGSMDEQKCQHSVINHCRWDSLKNIMPSLLFKKDFTRYVLDNFAANNTAACPVLYCLAFPPSK